MTRQQLNINIPESEKETFERFKEKCASRNQSMSKTILALMKDYTDILSASYALENEVTALIDQHVNLAVRTALDAAGVQGVDIGELTMGISDPGSEMRTIARQQAKDETSAPLPDFFR